jgi:predicted RNA binding protein YcfA (HicA-like mRNA interferase family)
MQPPTVREVIKKLENEGFVKVWQTGSHRRYKKGNRSVSVAGKLSEHLTCGSWKGIQRQAGW